MGQVLLSLRLRKPKCMGDVDAATQGTGESQ